jgi:acyl dehydratase
MALYFEDFIPGARHDSASRTLTQADIEGYAAVSGDHHPMHSDPATARAAGFPGVIAHGVLGLAVATGLAGRLGLTHGTLVALVGLSWRFRAPLLPGDTVTASLLVKECRTTSHADRGLVTLAVTLRNQRGETVQDGEWVELIRRRG